MTTSIAEFIQKLSVDIRDIRELWREGTVPGAAPAARPRGMLEFWEIAEKGRDPESPDTTSCSPRGAFKATGFLERSWCSTAPRLFWLAQRGLRRRRR